MAGEGSRRNSITEEEMDRIYTIFDGHRSLEKGLEVARLAYPHLFDRLPEMSDDSDADEVQPVGVVNGRDRTRTYGSFEEAQECCAAPSSVSPPVAVSAIAQVSVAFPPKPVIKKSPGRTPKMSSTLPVVFEEGGAGKDFDLGDAHSAGGARSPESVDSASPRAVTPVSEITRLLGGVKSSVPSYASTQ